jgi:hypothetical protein
MNTFRYGLLLIIISLFSACSLEKRVHRPGYHISWKEAVHASNIQKFDTRPEEQIKRSASKDPTIGEASTHKYYQDPTPVLRSISNTLQKVGKPLPNKKNQHRIETDSLKPCDMLTLNDGQDIEVKVIEIGSSIIKYRRCDNLDGPIISINKLEVFSIKYPGGQKDVFSTYVDVPATPVKSNTFGLASLVLGILSLLLLYLAPILGILAIIFGALALKQAGQNLDQKKVKRMATIGIICGGIALFIVGVYVLAVIQV